MGARGGGFDTSWPGCRIVQPWAAPALATARRARIVSSSLVDKALRREHGPDRKCTAALDTLAGGSP